MSDSQSTLVLRHLREHGDLSPAEGIYLYSIFRLAAVIKRLRSEGWDIKTNLKQVTVNGVVRPYARYQFSDEQAQDTAKPLNKKPVQVTPVGTPIVFQPGDQVKIAQKFDAAAAKNIAWPSAMDSTIGCSGYIEEVRSDRACVNVTGHGRWYYLFSSLKLVHRKGTQHAELKQLNEAHAIHYSASREAGVN